MNFVPTANWTDEDRDIFLKLHSRGHWPIDRDFSDFAFTKASLVSGSVCEGSRNFDWARQFMDSRKNEGQP